MEEKKVLSKRKFAKNCTMSEFLGLYDPRLWQIRLSKSLNSPSKILDSLGVMGSN